MRYPKEELRLTKTSPPIGMVETFSELYERTRREHPERHVYLIYYCGVCNAAIRYDKRRKGWVHCCDPLEFYSDFLERQKTHDITVKEAKVWLGQLKR